jgi:hypothetical protein
MEAAGVATYNWVIETDEIVWSSNAADVMGCDPAQIASGRAFASYLDPDNFTSRYDASSMTAMAFPSRSNTNSAPRAASAAPVSGWKITVAGSAARTAGPSRSSAPCGASMPAISATST